MAAYTHVKTKPEKRRQKTLRAVLFVFTFARHRKWRGYSRLLIALRDVRGAITKYKCIAISNSEAAFVVTKRYIAKHSVIRRTLRERPTATKDRLLPSRRGEKEGERHHGCSTYVWRPNNIRNKKFRDKTNNRQ